MISMIYFSLPLSRRLRSLHCYLPPHSMKFFSLLWFECIKEQLLKNVIRESLNILLNCVSSCLILFSLLLFSSLKLQKCHEIVYTNHLCWAAFESICQRRKWRQEGEKYRQKYTNTFCAHHLGGKCIEMIYLFIQLLIY